MSSLLLTGDSCISDPDCNSGCCDRLTAIYAKVRVLDHVRNASFCGRGGPIGGWYGPSAAMPPATRASKDAPVVSKPSSKHPRSQIGTEDCGASQ